MTEVSPLYLTSSFDVLNGSNFTLSDSGKFVLIATIAYVVLHSVYNVFTITFSMKMVGIEEATNYPTVRIMKEVHTRLKMVNNYKLIMSSGSQIG